MADNISISPDMINNLVNMLQNSTKSSDNNTSNPREANIDTSNLGDLFSSFTSMQNASENTNNSDSNNSSIDIDTILKIKSVMEKMNTKNDPRSNLLYSLKPYLRESKRSKLDQYANLLKITQVTGLFKNEKEN